MEILDGIKQEPITIYGIGGDAASEGEAVVRKEFHWWDLCAGPHLASTGQLNPKAIALLSIAGAYWRGDETKPMLQVRPLLLAVLQYLLTDSVVLISVVPSSASTARPGRPRSSWRPTS